MGLGEKTASCSKLCLSERPILQDMCISSGKESTKPLIPLLLLLHVVKPEASEIGEIQAVVYNYWTGLVDWTDGLTFFVLKNPLHAL